MSNDPTYAEVMDSTEPYRDDQPTYPVEVRREEREERSRGITLRESTRVSHRFFVVRHDEDEVVFAGRWTVDQHNPYEAAKARAYGYAAGLTAGDPEL